MIKSNTQQTSIDNMNHFYQESLAINYNTLSIKAFSTQILNQLNTIFGYEKSTFWLINPQNNTYFLAAHRLEKTLVNAYNKKYYKQDPLHPLNMTKHSHQKMILSIHDLMSTQEYETSNYYKKFLSQNLQYYHQTILYLYQNNQIIGGVGLLRSKREGDFRKEELKQLNLINVHISKLTSWYMALNDIKLQKHTFEGLATQSPVGQIIIEEGVFPQVRYINPLALAYISEIYENLNVDNYVAHFIKDYILDDQTAYMGGMIKTIFSSNMKKYKIKVCHSLEVSKNMLYIYITAQNSCKTICNDALAMQDCNQPLTRRQQEIVALVLKGFSNKDISKKLFISLSTVKTHLNNIYSNLNVKSRLELCVKLSHFV